MPGQESFHILSDQFKFLERMELVPECIDNYTIRTELRIRTGPQTSPKSLCRHIYTQSRDGSKTGIYGGVREALDICQTECVERGRERER
jgi:hypothetical protein